jgi:hypothetical protein
LFKILPLLTEELKNRIKTSWQRNSM